MADHQHIVDQIRAFIAATDQTKTPELADLAAEYAALCNEANARLRRCTDYLHRGLRAEAIHLADEHPVLLEVVAVLDMPEAAEWANLCATYELVRPPLLLIEAAQEVNEAYALAQPEEALLDRLRRLALDRAPLADRIAVMREVAKGDTASTFWDEDIRTFETVRLKEIKSEATRAIDGKDAQLVARLLAEINAPDWRLQTPADLRTRLTRAESATRHEETARQIRAILPELDVAYGAMDHAAVTAALMKIRGLAAQTRLVLPPDVAAQVEPAEQWVAHQNAIIGAQQQFTDACEALSFAADQNAPAARLRALKADAEKLGGAVPEELAGRVQQTIARQVSQQKIKARMRIGAIAATVLVVGAVAAVVQRQMSRSSRGDAVNAKLTTMLDSGTPEDLDSADQYLKQVAADTPYVMDRADIRRRIDQLEASKKLERDRSGTYAADLASAKAAVDGAVAKNVPAVSVWNGVNEVIDKAAHSAQNSAEKSAVSDLRDKALASSKKIKADEEERLRKTLADLTAKTTSVREAVNAGTGTVNPTAVASILQEVTAVKSAAQSAGLEPFQRQAQTLEEKLAQVKSALAHKTLETDELETVKRSIGTPDSLARALRSFAERCPDSEHAQRFKNSAANSRAWAAVEATTRLSNSFGGILKPDVSSLPQRVQALSDYLRDYSDSPWRAVFDDYETYLKTWQKAVAETGPWKKDFRNLLTLPLLKDRMCCKGADGKIYYLPPGQTVVNNDAGSTFKYMTSSAYILSGDSKALKATTLRPDQIKGGAVLSPQSAMAGELDKLAQSLGGEWETFAYTAVFKITDSKEVDPVLRIILLNRVLKYAKLISWGGEEAMHTLGSDLDAMNADEINWMNPDDGTVAAKREQAVQLLAKVNDLKKARDAVVAQRDALFKRLKIGVAGAGLLLKEPSGWTIITPVNAEQGRKVFAITPKQGWFQVADAQGGKFIVNPSAVARDADALDGSMIFVVDPQN